MDEQILKICKYGEDVLRLKAATVKDINQQLVDLIGRMARSMYHTHNGVGLAAPQVGRSLQLSIIDISMGTNPDDFMVMINPVIIETGGEEVGDEGCLSLPGFMMPVKRHARLVLQYFDLQGKEQKKEFEGFKARVVQHEIDHLDGTLIIDRVSALKRQLVKKEIKRLQRDGQWK